jgi:hypothetical protein
MQNTQKTDIDIAACIKLAGELGLELIPDATSDLWYYRPVILSDEGKQIIRCQPDPCEFKYSLDQVRAKLAMMVIFHENP